MWLWHLNIMDISIMQSYTSEEAQITMKCIDGYRICTDDNGDREWIECPVNGLVALASLSFVSIELRMGTEVHAHMHESSTLSLDREEIPYENNMKVNYFRLDLNLQISAKRKEMYSLLLYYIHFLNSIGQCAFPLYQSRIAFTLNWQASGFFFIPIFLKQSEVKPSQTE